MNLSFIFIDIETRKKESDSYTEQINIHNRVNKIEISTQLHTEY
jgi:hypothetical protein